MKNTSRGGPSLSVSVKIGSSQTAVLRGPVLVCTPPCKDDNSRRARLRDGAALSFRRRRHVVIRSCARYQGVHLRSRLD